MIALSVDVEDFIVGFHEGLVRSTWKVEGYVSEIYGFPICFNGDFEAIRLKNFTNFLLRFLYLHLIATVLKFLCLIATLSLFFYCQFL